MQELVKYDTLHKDQLGKESDDTCSFALPILVEQLHCNIFGTGQSAPSKTT